MSNFVAQNIRACIMKNLLYILSLVFGIFSYSGLLAADEELYLLAPTVDLGNDTVVCSGLLTLDAGNPGATYIWSTGALTQTITVSNTGIYWVDVTDLSGTTRDSIEVWFMSTPTDPTAMDTTICGISTIPLVSSPSGPDTYNAWFTQANPNSFEALGDSLIKTFDDTTTYYTQHITAPLLNFGADTSITSSKGYSKGHYGIMFNAFQDLILEEVTIHGRFFPEFDLELRDANGVLLATKFIDFPTGVNEYTVKLGFFVPAGTGYFLHATNLVGRLHVNSSVNFPLELSGIGEVTSGELNLAPTNGTYHAFYNMKVLPYTSGCKSSFVSQTVNFVSNTISDLGNDTVLCDNGSIILNAGSIPGANYQWSTGANGSQITVTQTGNYLVSDTQGSCSFADSIQVTVYSTLSAPAIGDSTFCSPRDVTLAPSGIGEYRFWYSDLQATQIISEGQTYAQFVQDTTQIFVRDVSGVIMNVGPPDLSISPTARVFNVDRGLIFDAHQDIYLKSVNLFVAVAPITDTRLTIALLDSNGVVMTEKPIFIPGSSQNNHRIPLFFNIPAGNGYVLLAKDITEGRLYRNTAADFPYEIPNTISIQATYYSSSSSSVNEYVAMYDWEIIPQSMSCSSPLASSQIDISLPISIPDSIYSCTDYQLDAGNLVGSFMWNTGENTQQITVKETGLYDVLVDNGQGCQARDTTFVEIPTDAGLPDDGILCGNTLTTNYQNAVFQWSTGATTSTIDIFTPGTYSVMVNEPRGCMLTDTIVVTGFDDFPVVNLGPDLSECDSVILDAGNPGLSFLWNTGQTSQQITASSSGLYHVNVTNSNGCTTADTIGISITPFPTAQFAVADTVYGGPNRRVSFVNQSTFGSYLWDFGDGNSSTSISPTHSYADTGTYCISLIVTDILNSCGQDTFERCVSVFQYPTGINDFEIFAQVNLFPNPTSDRLFLEMDSWKTGEISVQIVNINGQYIWKKVLQDQQKTYKLEIPTASWSPGIYQIIIQQNGKLMRQAFMKQ